MARVSLILGESASGKSRSVKNLPSKNTFIVNVVGKELPFPGSETKYPEFNMETGQGNLLVTKSTKTIAKVINISLYSLTPLALMKKIGLSLILLQSI